MAGVLEYILSLKTGSFENPLRSSESNLQRFETRAGRFSSGSGGLGGITAAFGGATAVVGVFSAAVAAAGANLESYAGYDGLVRGLRTLEGTAEATKARIAQMREVAKVPGLGFEEAVQGDIRLRSVGLSANLSERSMRAFGNALATVGGGKEQLDGVLLALTQIQAKGKVSAEEINQISERVPQVRAAMQAAFGTADTEALQGMGLTTTQFIEQLVAQLEKLPQVTSGARNSLDNYTDAWKELKTEANEFTVKISAGLTDTVAGVLKTASRDIRALKKLLGFEAPAMEGQDGDPQWIKDYRAKKAAAKMADEAEARAAAERSNQQIAREQQAIEDKAAKERYYQREREDMLKRGQDRVREANEKVYEATLTREQNLQRKIENLKLSGPSGKEAYNKIGDPIIKAEIAERTAQILALEKELADLRANEAEKNKRAADAAAKKAESVAKEASERNKAKAAFDLENQILTAKAAKNDKLVKQLERQAKVEQTKLELMRQQGLAEDAAAAAAEKRVALEERAANPKRGILNAGESAAARQERRSAADKARDTRLGRDGIAQADKLALDDAARRTRLINPDRAAAELAKATGKADPGKVRRDEKADQARQAADPVYRVVKSIEDKFANIVKV